MKKRFVNRAASTSFFAFQDIITAVMGIMVLIALLMSLQLALPRPGAPQTDPLLIQRLAELLAERDLVNDQIKLIVATAEPEINQEGIKAEVENIAEMVRQLNEESSRLVQEAGSLSASVEASVDREALLKANEEGRRKLAASEKVKNQLRREIESRELLVDKAQSALLKVSQNEGDVWLIPDRSGTSKEPVIISVLPDHFASRTFDAGEEKRTRRSGDSGDTSSELARLLESHQPTDQYLVFYYRPSTLGSFDKINQAAKDLGYEIGYDVVEEGAVVQFVPSLDDMAAADIPPPTETPSTSSADTASSGGGETVAGAPPPEKSEASSASGSGDEKDEGEVGADQETAESADPSTPSDVVDIQREVEKRGDPIANGSGFFINSQGYFVTNEHVAAAGTIFFVGSESSGWRQAELIAANPELDLALLKLDFESKGLPIASSNGVKLGTPVATIGFPNIELQGFSPKFTKGEISSLLGPQDEPTKFQISVPVQPGNSGGPLFTEAGHVVGVVSARLSQAAAVASTGQHAENVNYAVKSSMLLDWLGSLDGPEVDGSPSAEESGDGFFAWLWSLIASWFGQGGSTSSSFEEAIESAQQSTTIILIFP